jgi:hypothetical protein
VTDFARHAKNAVPWFPIDDKSTTYSRSQRNHAKIVNMASGSQPLLSQRGAVGIVVKEYWGIQAASQVVSRIVGLPTRQICRRVEPSAFHVDYSGQADAHPQKRMGTSVFSA